MARSFAVLFLSLVLAGPAMAAVQVATSIKPLQLLAAGITEGVSTPQLLMPEGQDPHHFALRPSDRQALADSAVVLWVGPALERPLAGVMRQISGHVITALDVPGMILHEQEGVSDPHLWLDADNAIRLARELTATLAEKDPDHAARYRDNLARLEARLTEVDRRLGSALAALPDPAYAVYHNAFLYMERRYGLDNIVSFKDHEDVAPGIRRLMEVRRLIAERGTDCVLVEPDVDVGQLRGILDDPDLRFQVVDVLGRGQAPRADAFPSMLAEAGMAILTCLR